MFALAAAASAVAPLETVDGAAFFEPFSSDWESRWLVPKDADPTTTTSPACSALVFAEADRLRRHEEALLTLASHPGKAVVPKNGVPWGPFNVGGDAWLVVGGLHADALLLFDCVGLELLRVVPLPGTLVSLCFGAARTLLCCTDRCSILSL